MLNRAFQAGLVNNKKLFELIDFPTTHNPNWRKLNIRDVLQKYNSITQKNIPHYLPMMNIKNIMPYQDSAIVFLGNRKLSQNTIDKVRQVFNRFEQSLKEYQLFVLHAEYTVISRRRWRWMFANKFKYFRPDLVLINRYKPFSINQVSLFLKLSLGIPNDDRSLITWVDQKTNKREVIYFESELNENDLKKVVERICGHEIKLLYNKALQPNPEGQFPKDSPGYISETKFNKKVEQLHENARKSVKILRQLKADKQIVDLVIFAIQQLDAATVELPKELKSILPQLKLPCQTFKLSRVVIDDLYRLWLPDYNNMEIKMGNLPKALFILFLKHPEGIILKELPDYYNQLHRIYGRISNLSNPKKITIAVNQLVDVTDNSLYVNLSRVKKAFTKKMYYEIARQYYITGEKCQPKKIILDRALVQLSGKLISDV